MEEIDHRVPKDVIHEILLRLPIKSIIRFQLVSKQWHSLIFNPFFTKSHLQLTKSPPLNLVIEFDHLSIIKFKASYYAECITKSNGLDLAPLDHVLPPEIKGCRDNYLIGSSDGLLCIYSYWFGCIRQPPEFICLYNPATRACRQITRFTPPSLSTRDEANASGFGFVPSISDCKIVMLRRVCDCITSFGPYISSWKGHVYSMKDNEWTELDTTSIANIEFVDCHRHAVSVAILFNEALHWVVSESAGRDFLLKFDLVEEEFEKFELVKLSDHDDRTPANYYFNYRYFGTMEPNNLCYCQQTTIFVELWMLERYGEWNSWKKLFRFEFNAQIRRHVPHLLGTTSCGKVLIHTNKGLAFVCVSTDRHIAIRRIKGVGDIFIVPLCLSMFLLLLPQLPSSYFG